MQAIAEYSADCMRWTLADAGDSLEDANFETTTANAVILRLTKELAWIDEMLAPGAGVWEECIPCRLHPLCLSFPCCRVPIGLREDGELTLQDRVFANEINIAVHKAKEAYDNMVFREALKISAYDLGGARDVYRYEDRGFGSPLRV